MKLITCENVTLGYDGTKVVQGLNFSVSAGEYLCIVGENGSGKSTLMKALLKLKEPMAGQIKMGEGLHQTQIGYLPQQTQIQKDFPASVMEVALSGCLNRCGLRPYYSREEKSLAMHHLNRMGVGDLAKHCYRELSGGQQQRVLLARALCAARKVLLLDEPTAGLDPIATKEMYALIQQLNREDGMTVMMISHDIACAVRYADHILHIGQTPLFYGSTSDYIKSPIGNAFFMMHGGEKP